MTEEITAGSPAPRGLTLGFINTLGGEQDRLFLEVFVSSKII